MRIVLPLSVVFVFASFLHARPTPLTAKEISLMLRSGFSSEAVMRELAERHFAGSCDETTKKLLTQSGATPALVDSLASGAYSVSPEQAARAQEELAAQTKRRAAAVEESRKFDTLYQNQLAQTRATASSSVSGSSAIYPIIKGDLVCYKNGSVTHFDDESFEKKKLIALYFSAHWCLPCRKFTPQLVDYYSRAAAEHPEFELLFVSFDRSPSAMETYMHDTQMPWPAIDFQKVASKTAITKYAGSGIPDLVLIDATGKVLSDSYAGKEYLGPQKVLADLDQIFASGGAQHVAQGK